MVVSLNAIQIIGLLALVLVIPIYQGVRNWREVRTRQQMAATRGWRYSEQGWKALFKSTYSMAGTTPNGTVWILKRVQRNKRWEFIWSSPNKLLPYGKLLILPREVMITSGYTAQANLRQTSYGSKEWQAEYALLTTHDALGKRFFNKEIELALLNWPRWPALGSLEKVDWSVGELVICGRHQKDWLALDRIVVLGTALIENAKRQ